MGPSFQSKVIFPKRKKVNKNWNSEHLITFIKVVDRRQPKASRTFRELEDLAAQMFNDDAEIQRSGQTFTKDSWTEQVSADSKDFFSKFFSSWDTHATVISVFLAVVWHRLAPTPTMTCATTSTSATSVSTSTTTTPGSTLLSKWSTMLTMIATVLQLTRFKGQQGSYLDFV